MYRDIIFLPVSVRNGAPRVSATHPALKNGKFESAVSEKSPTNFSLSHRPRLEPWIAQDDKLKFVGLFLSLLHKSYPGRARINTGIPSSNYGNIRMDLKIQMHYAYNKSWSNAVNGQRKKSWVFH